MKASLVGCNDCFFLGDYRSLKIAYAVVVLVFLVSGCREKGGGGEFEMSKNRRITQGIIGKVGLSPKAIGNLGMAPEIAIVVYNQKKTKIIKTTISDQKGCFEIKLEEGVYWIKIEGEREEERVQVKRNTITKIDLLINPGSPWYD